MAQANVALEGGEYAGRTFGWILMNRPHYVTWARTQPSPQPNLAALLTFADTVAAQGIPTATDLAHIDPQSIMRVGQFRGRTFAWITLHCHHYTAWIRGLVPRCSTEFFRLIQYADHDGTAASEAVWAPLRVQHIEWMRQRQVAQQAQTEALHYPPASATQAAEIPREAAQICSCAIRRSIRG